MKTMPVQELRDHAAALLSGDEAVLLTRQGKPAGVLYPFTRPEKLPAEVRRDLFLELSGKIGEELDKQGVTEDDLQRDFEEFRRQRRR